MDIHTHPLLIFIGSRLAGRMLHQQRLVESRPWLFAPVKTLTTRKEPKPGDDVWFTRLSGAEIARYGTDDLLTHFREGRALYFVLKAEVTRVMLLARTAIVGMTPKGFERLESRPAAERRLSYCAVLLQPADPDEFRGRLERERGLDPELAREETERAVRLSTIPPAAVKNDSVRPIAVRGDDGDLALVDKALSDILSM